MKARKIISVLLAVLLAGSTACFAVFAADDVTETVSVSSGAVTVGNVKVENSLRAVEVRAQEESASVKVQGNVTLTNIENDELNGATAVAVDNYGYLAVADISGNVSLEGGNDVTGIMAYDGNARVGGNVSSKGGNYVTGVDARADEKTDVDISGSVSSEGYCATGVRVESYPNEHGGGDVNVKVGNGITATGKEPVTDTDYEGYGSGIDLYRGGGDINVEVNGDITATNDGKYATGMYLSDCYEELMSSTYGTNTIIVRGDVITDGYGIECYPLSGYSEDGTPLPGGTTDILIEGTMDAKKAGFATHPSGVEGPVVIIDTPDGVGGSEIINGGDYEAEEPETNVNLTIWKIKLNENG
ncbi:MAG: hypothetical protein IK085_04635, partial [Clostridia bacterium]|nr:hypothetical protein [Clostridia bacterium]